MNTDPAQKNAIPRPPAGLVFGTPEHLIAFGFGAGLAPFAPGTFGTLVAIPMFVALCWLPALLYVVLVMILFGLGWWACGRSARLLGVHDYGGIVFDEVVGFLVTALPLLSEISGDYPGPLWGWLLGAFAVFRFFDIVKPWPIRGLDRHVHGGFGIMLDDLVAGIYSAAVVALAVVIAKAFG